MAPSRDRISVDLRGLKAALVERARAQGASPSEVVRAVLAHALEGQEPSIATRPTRTSRSASDPGRVRLSMRLSRQDARAIALAAQRSGLSIGGYLTALAAGMPAKQAAAAPADHLAALVASNAAMAVLGRELRHLTSLLRQGSIRAAQEYRQSLDHAASEVARHLALASAVLAELRPLRLMARRHADRPTPTQAS